MVAKKSGKRARKRGLQHSPKAAFVPADPSKLLRRRIEKRLEISKKVGAAQAKAKRSSNHAGVSKASVERVIERLPSMEPAQLVRIWKNAIRLIAKADSNKVPHGPLKVLKAVEAEWRGRGQRQYDPDEYFKWPSTEASGGDKSLSFAGISSDGILSYLEYHVGKVNGEAAPVRRAILDRVYCAFLPPVFAKEYMDEWSSPNSAGRLQKMAETLAAFSRNAKRRDADLLDEAIRQWEEDLEYLYEKYYIGRFQFGWPSSALS